MTFRTIQIVQKLPKRSKLKGIGYSLDHIGIVKSKKIEIEIEKTTVEIVETEVNETEATVGAYAIPPEEASCSEQIGCAVVEVTT